MVKAREHGRAGALRRGRASGFTLVEVMVAVTILVTVMAGVGLLFANSMRLARQIRQSREVFELARAALSIVERDLRRAFTAREYGDYYQFYGSPIGMVFVGLVSPRESAEPNLARVTYVIYHDPEDIGPYRVGARSARTFKLLRYVEPNKEDIDDFPVDWYNFSLNTPEAPGLTLGTLIDQACECDGSEPSFLDDWKLQRVNAKKRELWIRLLSGGDDLLSTFELFGAACEDTFGVPNGWDPDSQRASLIGLGNIGSIEDPEDYVVTESLLYDYAWREAIDPDILEDMTDLGLIPSISECESAYENGRPQFFSYRVFGVRGPGNDGFDNDNDGFIDEPDEDPGRDGFDNDFDGEIDEPGEGTALDGYDNDGDGFIDELGEGTVVVAIPLRYWNGIPNIHLTQNGIDDDGDNRARERDGLDNDGDGEIDEDGEGIDEPDEGIGSPYYPRLPEGVVWRFTLHAESTAIGAPDYRRSFEEWIAIPSAHRRAL